MVNMPIWQRILVLGIVVFAAFFALPNFSYQRVEQHNDALTRIELDRAETGDEEAAASWPSWLPSQIVNLGLDLRGGVHVLVEVQVEDVYSEHYDNFWVTARELMRERKSEFGSVERLPSEDALLIKIDNASASETVVEYLRQSATSLGSNDFEYSANGNIITVSLTEAAKGRIDDLTMERSLEIVRRRIDAAGTKEPTISRQGEDRIMIDVPGFGSVEEVMALIGRTAKLTLHNVISEEPDASASTSFDEIILPVPDEGGYLRLNREAVVTGDTITDARLGFDPDTNAPLIAFNLNTVGAKAFGDHTAKNVGRRFAIVLDEEVITAPNILGYIGGGSAQITGSFTVEEAEQLAVLLRSGALPAELLVLEQSVVGPDLGQDSIDAGSLSAMIALGVVAIYMVFAYRLYGAFATGALIVNMILIVACLSLIGSVLTLPGIAGIVLTIGMAVDANVLIFERIREEYALKPSVIKSIDNGFSRALSSILDANITTFIAAMVLFYFGVGPVRGFSITLMIGIITSVFSAVYVTRLFVVWYVDRRNPKSIPFANKTRRFADKAFNFMKRAPLFIGISLVLMSLSLVLFFWKGPNYGIDFKGGTMFNIQVAETVSVGDVRAVVSETFSGDIAVTTNSDSDIGKQGMFVRLSSDGDVAAMSEDEISALRDALTAEISGADIRGVNSIGGAVSGEMVQKGLLAIGITLFAIGVYIWLRFEAAYSLGAIFALLHDVSLTIGFFAITGFTFDLSVVAALLAIIGYSLNDTVVVYDRIREQFAKSDKAPIREIINSAINSTLSRTLVTSGTTLLAVLAILIFGGPALQSFSIAMLFGIVIGTYSSVFVASPILLRFGVKREDGRKAKQSEFANIDA